MSTATVSVEWISGAAASRLLGFRTEKPVVRLAEGGHLTVRRLPNGRPRYLLPDLLRIAAAGTHPAKEYHA
jgi:hypothetical protein